MCPQHFIIFNNPKEVAYDLEEEIEDILNWDVYNRSRYILFIKRSFCIFC